MSLVNFRAENHPQQVGKRAARDDVDDRGTHPIHFAEFEAEFGPFTLDVAAAEHNAKCDAYYDRDIHALPLVPSLLEPCGESGVSSAS